MAVLPASPTALSADWLDASLHESGVLATSHETDAQHEVVGEGTGVFGQLARISLGYDTREDGAPSTLIAKMASAADANRELGNQIGLYERELAFYEQLADDCPLRVPACYFLARGEQPGEFVLLIEDMAPAVIGDQIAGATLEQARLAVQACARLNAKWWDSPVLDDLTWLPALDASSQIPTYDSVYRAAWDPFLEKVGDSLSAHVREAGAAVARDMPGLMHRLQQSPAANTLIHGDPRLDNMFFGGPEMPFALIDWQLSLRANPGVDLAWFLNQSIDIELRRAHESDLLDLYLAELAANGVTSYDRAQLWEDYKLATLWRFLAPVVACSGDFDMANERGQALAETLLRRNAAAIDDHHLGDLI